MEERLRGTKPDTTSGFGPVYALTREHRDAVERIQRTDGELGASVVHADFLESLRRRAATLNTHATTSLEGNPLDRAAVAGIERTLGRKRTTPSEIEVANHLRYHARLARQPPREPLSLSEIQATHRELLWGVLETGLGSWKVNPNVITDEETGADVFYPTPPQRVEGELRALSEWFDADPLPTLVRVAIWTHEFLSIHPFRDGNGRTGRALTHRLLASAGFAGMKFVALDAEFLANRRGYMEALRRVQTTRWDHAGWVTFFLASLERAYADARAAVRGQAVVSEGLDGLRRSIVEWVLQKGGASFARADLMRSDAARDYHDVSVSHALTWLTQAEYLQASGNGRARRYRPGPRFRELLQDR